MRALVTGATGFLGSHLCAALLARGHFVVALIRDALPGHKTAQQVNVAVFGGFDQVERAIAEYEVDTVFHLAAQTQVSVAASDPVGTLEANVQGTWKVLEACRRQHVRRVVVASSDKAYGNAPTPYKESQSLRPYGIYATSKACQDMIAKAYTQEFGMSIATTRCGNLYGPGHTNWSTLVPGTIRSVLRGARPQLRSDGKARRDFLYVDDAVDGYLALAKSKETGAFNFGMGLGPGGDGITVLQMVKTIIDLMGSDLEPVIAASDAPGAGGVEIDEQVLDCTKARNVLGWSRKVGLIPGLQRTIEWHRKYLGVER